MEKHGFLLKKGDSGLVIDKRMLVVVVVGCCARHSGSYGVWFRSFNTATNKLKLVGAQAPGRRLVAFIFAPCRVSGFLKVNVAEVEMVG